jgi:uncharacterized repeat protein (TIGR03803 family)
MNSRRAILRVRDVKEHCGWRIACGIFLFCAAVISAPAQTFTDLFYFPVNPGIAPSTPLVQGIDGNFYGATKGESLTKQGGCTNCGSVFKITPAGKLTTLYHFCTLVNCADGAVPLGRLVEGPDGSFYGTTTEGGDFTCGANGCGTIFKITRAGKLTTLHTFTGPDGSFPQGALVLGPSGVFYGVATGNGANGGGTFFKITAGTLTTIYNFCAQSGCIDGGGPTGVIQATDGFFYGTTGSGGDVNCFLHSCGTVFRLTPFGTLTTLHAFTGLADGAFPQGGLVQGADGELYGMTVGGGVANGATPGVIFKITPGGALTTLYTFCSQSGCSDGSGSNQPLIQATDGNFYGVTCGCGNGGDGNGNIFRMTPSGTFTVMHALSANDGADPRALLQATSGVLYGTTLGGATSNVPMPFLGTVFSLDVGLGPFVAPTPVWGLVGTRVTILGNNLTGTSAVGFNGASAAFTVVSDSEITTTVPAGATTGAIQVTTPSVTLSSNTAFRVTPQVLSFSPTSGPVGSTETITGVSLTGATVVSFNGVQATSFTVDSDTKITVTVPTGATSGFVAVRTPGGRGQSATNFTVTP